ncbi:MAG: YciI family protein [Gammaproteobacteria bacterium]
MAFIAICSDAESVNSAELREANLQAHFSYIETILDHLLVAGPAGGASNEEFSFSLFVYATDDEEEARRLLQGDPYFQCGLYGEVRLEPFIPAAGQWIGGKVW